MNVYYSPDGQLCSFSSFVFSSAQLWVGWRGRLGFLTLHGNQSKWKTLNINHETGNGKSLYFPRIHSNSHIIMNRNQWRDMIACILKGHGIKKIICLSKTTCQVTKRKVSKVTMEGQKYSLIQFDCRIIIHYYNHFS